MQASAEHRNLLWHSHLAGRARGVRHMRQRQRRHSGQMIELSEPATRSVLQAMAAAADDAVSSDEPPAGATTAPDLAAEPLPDAADAAEAAAADADSSMVNRWWWSPLVKVVVDVDVGCLVMGSVRRVLCSRFSDGDVGAAASDLVDDGADDSDVDSDVTDDDVDEWPWPWPWWWWWWPPSGLTSAR